MMAQANTQANILALAKQGDATAIAALINRALNPKGIAVKADLQKSCLHLFLESSQVPNQHALVPFICQGMTSLRVKSIKTIKIYGRKVGEKPYVWQQEVDIGIPITSNPHAVSGGQLAVAPKATMPTQLGTAITTLETTLQVAQSQPSLQVNTSTVTSSPAAPLAPTMPANVEARVYGDLSGQQISIGNNNLQITNSGGIINVTTPEQQPTIRPRSTPVSLRPRSFANFLSRKAEVAAAIATLKSALPVEFYGEEGLGKTVLLRYLAHLPEAVEGFTDGIVYLSAHRQVPLDLLQSLFKAFYESDKPVVRTEVEIRHDLQGRNVLVLLDDVELAREELEQLIDIVPSLTFLIAGSERHLWGEGKTVSLQGFPLNDALLLVERELGRSLTAAELPLANELCEILKGHPLRILQAVATVHERRSLVELVQQLKAIASPEALTVKLSASLPEPERRTLAALVVLGGTPVHIGHLSSLTALPNIQPVLKTLLQRGLVQVDGLRCSLSHNLVEPFQQMWDLAPWTQRVLTHFTSWAEGHMQAPGSLVEESGALLQVLDSATKAGSWHDVLHLSRLIEGALMLQDRWGIWEQVLQLSLQAARSLQDPFAEAWALHQLGSRALCLEDPFLAYTLLTQALQLREVIGDQPGLAVTRHNLNFLLVVPPAHQQGEQPLPPPTVPLPLKAFLVGVIPLTVGVIAAFVGWFSPPVSPPVPTVSINFQEINFDERELQTTSEPQMITLTNSGSAPLQVNDVEMSGDIREFAIAEDTCSDGAIAPEDTCDIQITFTPTTSGSHQAELSISHNAVGSPHTISLSGSGTERSIPSINLDPLEFQFNEQALGTRSEIKTVRLTNDGSAALEISNIAIAGNQQNDFTLVTEGDGSCPLATSLAPQESCILQVRFAPTAEGRRRAELVITNSAANSPHQLVLSGTGTATPQIPIFRISSTDLSFVDQVLGTQSDPKTITLKNQGGGVLRVRSIDLAGEQAEDFVADNGCANKALAAGEECAIAIRFSPTAPGDRRASLTITHNAADRSQPVSLAGNATRADQPPVEILSFNPDPTVVEVGQSTNLCYEVINASSVRIEPTVGNVEADEGCVQVSPQVTTSYTLIARAANGREAQRDTRVEVTQPPDRQPPATPDNLAPGNVEQSQAPGLYCGNSLVLSWKSVSDPSSPVTYLVSLTRQDFNSTAQIRQSALSQSWSPVIEAAATTEAQMDVTQYLQTGFVYRWTVRSQDTVGNTSQAADWHYFGCGPG